MLIVILNKILIFRDIDKSNAVEIWSPHQYVSAAGYLDRDKLPSAMDFMNRLNCNLSAIDFNCTTNINVTESEGKRARNVSNDKSNVQTTSACSTYKRKKYKLAEMFNINSNASQEDNTIVSQSNTNEDSKSESKIVPENRVEFLKVVSVKI